MFFVFFFLLWLIVTCYYVKVNLWCSQGYFCVLDACVMYSSPMNSVSESFIKLFASSLSVHSTSSHKAYICSLLAFSSIWKYLSLLLVDSSPQKIVLFWFEKQIYLEKSYCILWIFTSYSSYLAWKTSKYTIFRMIFELFFMGEFPKFQRCSKNNSLKYFIIFLKITIPNLRDISVTTNRNDY